MIKVNFRFWPNDNEIGLAIRLKFSKGQVVLALQFLVINARLIIKREVKEDENQY